MKHLVIIICCTIEFFGLGQNFVNGELNGVVNFVSVPTSWTQVPFTDPICQGNSIPEATVDIVDVTGPSITGGVVGNPYSGSTFCTGLHAYDGSSLLWHEGIMQDVSGLTIGVDYTISFYQTVLKQTNCLDESGSWRVYLDNNLISTTTPSVSMLSAIDPALVWENRQVTFTASSTTHTLKFMAWDDDANQVTSYADISGGLRMGIDLITFIQDTPQIDLGADTLLCTNDTIVLDASYAGSTYLWNDNSTNSTLVVSQPGTYWVTTTNSFGSDTDTIVVDFTSLPVVNLGADRTICTGDSTVLSTQITGVTYLWQDGSNLPSININTQGEYWLTISGYCGNSSDTVQINYEDCTFHLDMPNVFTPNGDPNNSYFIPVYANGILEGTMTILNRWGNTVYQGDLLSFGWDGKNKGVDCTEGVYFWKVDYTRNDEQSGSKHGYLHLYR